MSHKGVLQENAEYTETLSANTAAKDLLNMAKNRLNKFYNPKMHLDPALLLFGVGRMVNLCKPEASRASLQLYRLIKSKKSQR